MTQEKPILEVKNISKKFCKNLRRSMAYGAIDLVSDFFGRSPPQDRLRPAEFWALNNVSFSLNRGDTLGLVGTNGSGKSTLLRLISGIYPPDLGSITVRGRIGALIALGAGFHPHMSGLENIYINGTIMGMTKAEIDARLEEIIDFSELRDFIHSPIATYSSGMTSRLGFAIAVNSRPDILVVDEVLAVGDLAFGIKCHRKMSEFRQNGGTTILVSHSNQLIRNVCKKAVWLNKGVVEASGDVQDICSLYEASVLKGIELGNPDGPQVINYDSDVKITRVEILGEDQRPKSEFKVRDTMRVRISVESRRPIVKPVFTISIHNAENIQVISNYTSFDGWSTDQLLGKATMDFVIDKLLLNPSKYFLSLTLSEREVNSHLEWHEKAYSFSVVSGPVSYGIYNPEPSWEFKEIGL